MNRKCKVSIIIVSYNTKRLTLNCIDSIYKYTKNLKFEIIVVDNNSTDGSREKLSRKYSDKKTFKFVKSSENVGFGAANNLGVKKAKGQYLLFFNSDTELKDNFLNEIIDWMDKNPETGISSCALKNSDGSMQITGGYFPNLFRVAIWMTIQDLPMMDTLIKPFHPRTAYISNRELDWVTGAFFLVRKKVFDSLKGFDQDYFMYTEEVDFCYRAKRLGWKVSLLPQWSIIHHGRGSSNLEFSILSEITGLKIFFKKHYPKWQYLPLRILLKIGSFWRILLNYKIYAKAFIKA